MADRCRCCDLPVGSCGKAAEKRQLDAARAERRQLLAMPGVFAAQHASPCVACPTWIQVGDPITHALDRAHRGSGWLHADCRDPI